MFILLLILFVLGGCSSAEISENDFSLDVFIKEELENSDDNIEVVGVFKNLSNSNLKIEYSGNVNINPIIRIFVYQEEEPDFINVSNLTEGKIKKNMEITNIYKVDDLKEGTYNYLAIVSFIHNNKTYTFTTETKEFKI